jgi:hypothetical protein
MDAFTVACGGDVNADGMPDVLVGGHALAGDGRADDGRRHGSRPACACSPARTAPCSTSSFRLRCGAAGSASAFPWPVGRSRSRRARRFRGVRSVRKAPDAARRRP